MDAYIIAYIMLVYRTPCPSTPLLVDARWVVVDHATDDAGVPSLRRAVSPGLYGRRSHSDEAAAARPLLAGGRTARVRVSGAGRPTARRRDDDDVRGAAACPGGVERRQTVAAHRRDDVGRR